MCISQVLFESPSVFGRHEIYVLKPISFRKKNRTQWVLCARWCFRILHSIELPKISVEMSHVVIIWDDLGTLRCTGLTGTVPSTWQAWGMTKSITGNLAIQSPGRQNQEKEDNQGRWFYPRSMHEQQVGNSFSPCSAKVKPVFACICCMTRASSVPAALEHILPVWKKKVLFRRVVLGAGLLNYVDLVEWDG